MLINFLESLRLLSSFSLLLVEVSVRELLEVLSVHFLHDEVQRARRDEFGDGARVTRQILEG